MVWGYRPCRPHRLGPLCSLLPPLTRAPLPLTVWSLTLITATPVWPALDLVTVFPNTSVDGPMDHAPRRSCPTPPSTSRHSAQTVRSWARDEVTKPFIAKHVTRRTAAHKLDSSTSRPSPPSLPSGSRPSNQSPWTTYLRGSRISWCSEVKMGLVVVNQHCEG